MPDVELVSLGLVCRRALWPCLILLAFSSRLTSAAPLEIGGGKIDIVFDSDDSDFPRPLAVEWITTAARAVTQYYGRYPVSHAVVRIHDVAGDRIGSGETFGTHDGGMITVEVGRATT